MELKDLIGFQLIGIDDVQMTVSDGSNTYEIMFDCDGGDCCGYAEITNTLLFSPDNTKANPVIMKVEHRRGEPEYDEDNILITFFGEYKPLAKIDAKAGSGSGWEYGASVTATCKSLGIDEEIAVW